MSDISELLTFLFFIVAPIVAISFHATYENFSRWLRKKETFELKALDYEIAAAENELHYEEAALRKVFPFNYLVLEPGRVRQHQHCFSFSSGQANIKIFDEYYSGNGAKYTGIWVEFEDVRLPYFDILRTSAPRNMYPEQFWQQVRLTPAIDWLSGRYKVIKPHRGSMDPVNNRLAQSAVISTLINRDEFLILTVRDRNLCLYFEMSLPADSRQIYQLKQDANLLVNTFSQPINLSAQLPEIEQLKRDEQEDNSG